MPYKTNDDLPPSIKKLPIAAQTIFRKAFNASYGHGYEEEVCFKVAWAAVKKRFKKKEGAWVAKSDAFKSVTYFTLQTNFDEGLVSKTEDGKTVYTYVLTDTLPDKDGNAPTEELLQKWAEEAVGLEIDTDHDVFMKAVETYKGNVELVSKAVKYKRGIARIIDAAVKAGKLFVKVAFDKRYTKYVNKIKGLSLEAAAKFDDLRSTIISGDLLGATFALSSDPVNPRAVRYAA